jgi:hypothetical protein
MMRRTHLQENISQNSPHVLAKSRFASRPFAAKEPMHEALSAESPDSASHFGHSFADIDIFPRPVVQPKLMLGPVGDKYEQEADRVADAVMRMAEPCPKCQPEEESLQAKPIADQITPLMQRQEAELVEVEEEEEEELIQPKQASTVGLI